MDIDSLDLKTQTARTLKTISKTDDELRVGNYMALFGGGDLEGEHFTPETDFESAYTKHGRLDVSWEHGLGQRLDGKDSPGPNDVLGFVDWKTAKTDAMGLWVERVLDRRNAYMKYIEVLIENGLISNSSEALSEYVKKGRNGEITSWPLYKDTLTVWPMEPRMMTANVISAVKGLNIMPDPTEENISDAETKALKKKAFDMLVDDAVDKALTDRVFDRDPTEMEILYERAALGILNHFQNNELIESCPVRITEYMPPFKGEKNGMILVGRFTDTSGPQILLRPRPFLKDQYKTFLHEVGHFLDEKLRGETEYYDTDYCIKSTAREDTADEYRDLLGWFAFGQARRQFYGGKMSVKSIPINKLLEALS